MICVIVSCSAQWLIHILLFCFVVTAAAFVIIQYEQYLLESVTMFECIILWALTMYSLCTNKTYFFFASMRIELCTNRWYVHLRTYESKPCKPFFRGKTEINWKSINNFVAVFRCLESNFTWFIWSFDWLLLLIDVCLSFFLVLVYFCNVLRVQHSHQMINRTLWLLKNAK